MLAQKAGFTDRLGRESAEPQSGVLPGSSTGASSSCRPTVTMTTNPANWFGGLVAPICFDSFAVLGAVAT
jgi:hypothetical protein